MDQDDFLSHLEYALCDHLRGTGAWCDGFNASGSFRTTRATFIHGECWMMDAPGAEKPWRFELRVNEPIAPSADWGEIEAEFDVDFTEQHVSVHCGRAGTTFAPSDVEPVQDALDYLEFSNIPTTTQDIENERITISLSPGSELLVLRQAAGWAVDSRHGSLLFQTWKEACDYVVLLRDSANST